jgi:hypothetical protein
MSQIAKETRSLEKDAFIYINNRLEGNAPSTIEAVVGAIES